ncbi:hypothetical protein BN134_1549 [Cronobacter dublinensis 1210]|uniref:Uncharacterized protein n=1 Tax=Cronobacter dublinensis 1210 TaxID=1208656 RepID=A0ABM9Q5U6_9ENTR|nr:hypothetical protein BN134_1549 [Cronobacter dublinensis 1210]
MKKGDAVTFCFHDKQARRRHIYLSYFLFCKINLHGNCITIFSENKKPYLSVH